MLPILGFRMYYSDGAVWTDEDGSWDDAPAEDVQAVVLVHHEDYRTLLLGEDTYAVPDLGDDVKQGAWMPDADFEALHARVRGEL